MTRLKEVERLLSEVYEWRNGPDRWDAGKILRKLDKVKDLLDALPKGDKQQEFERRRLYHLGLVHREVWSRDHFLKAAAIHEQAAALAPTPKKRLIECVFATVERMHHAVETNDQKLLKKQLVMLRKHEADLREVAAQAPDAESTQRLAGDIPAHRFYCAELLRVRKYQERDSDLTALATLPDQIRELYGVCNWIALGLAAIGEGKSDAALYLADEALLSPGEHPTHVCFALYIRALAFAQLGKKVLARNLLQNVVDYPSHAAHFVRAAAKRKIKALTQKK